MIKLASWDCWATRSMVMLANWLNADHTSRVLFFARTGVSLALNCCDACSAWLELCLWSACFTLLVILARFHSCQTVKATALIWRLRVATAKFWRWLEYQTLLDSVDLLISPLWQSWYDAFDVFLAYELGFFIATITIDGRVSECLSSGFILIPLRIWVSCSLLVNRWKCVHPDFRLSCCSFVTAVPRAYTGSW